MLENNIIETVPVLTEDVVKKTVIGSYVALAFGIAVFTAGVWLLSAALSDD